VPANSRDYQYNFAWVNYIGATIIDRITFLVGGQKIQEFDNTYIVAKAHADMTPQQLEKWKRLVGEVPELTNPGMGQFGGGSEIVGYPIVYQNPNIPLGSQTNRPSSPRTTLRVPIPFWFSEDASLALPLVASKYSECEIQVQLRPLQDLYTVLDGSGNRVRPGFKMTSLNVNNPEFLTEYTVPEFREFLVDIGTTSPPLNMLSIRPRLEVTYAYITTTERTAFVNNSLSYLVAQPTRYNHTAIYNRQQLELEVHNLGRRIFICPRRTDSMQYRNAWYNFTNWCNYPFGPYIPTPTLAPYANLIYSSGLLVPQGQQDIIRNIRFLVDGNELQEEKDARYYDYVVPYKYMNGDLIKGTTMMNFGLLSTPTQPAGTLNMSLIKDFQVEVDVWPLPQMPNYMYDLTFYLETYNHVIFENGYGGLKYAL
jgi:hypothetical protein